VESTMPAFNDATNPSGLPFPTLEVSQVRLSSLNARYG
jgi:hypothetical protein